jgi:hypothetical protein
MGFTAEQVARLPLKGGEGVVDELVTEVLNLEVRMDDLEDGVYTLDELKTDLISEETAGSGVTVDGAKLKDGCLDLSSSSPGSHPVNFEGLTLAASKNCIRGASVNPTRTSGWISFSGTISATPAQCYTDYRNLTTTGVAEVLGIGSFPMMATGSSCASMFALQAICQVDSGATVATAAGAPAVGIFPLFSKVLIDGATFHASGVAACAWMSFQANVTDVQARDTSIINAEVASGGIQNIIKFQCSAAKGATYAFNFTDDNGEPALSTQTNGGTQSGWMKVIIGSAVRYIRLWDTAPS